MTVTIRVPNWRSLALVFVGAILGAALVAPVTARVGGSTSEPAVEPAAIHTRTASCAGLSFYPTDSRTEYDNHGTLRVRKFGDHNHPSAGVFRCDPGLPNRAVVTRVRFTLRNANEGVGDCALVRSGLTVATATSFEMLATIPDPTTNGVIRLSDSSISFATVDNTRYAYWLECEIFTSYGWGSTSVPMNGIYGADVTYTISSANG